VIGRHKQLGKQKTTRVAQAAREACSKKCKRNNDNSMDEFIYL
jgi:hypothetical protein